MAEDREPMVWSDAWLLLSILLATSDDQPADLAQIVHAGDYVNHAIFTETELTGGLRRLEAAGHVIEEDGRYRAGPSAREWYEKATNRRRALLTLLDDLTASLGMADPRSGNRKGQKKPAADR